MAEGRQWWLQHLQQQRAQQATGARRSAAVSSPPAGSSHAPAAAATPADDRARRRSSLLQDSEALLRRMSRPEQQHEQQHEQQQQQFRDGRQSGGAAAAAPAPPALGRAPTFKQCGSLAEIATMGRADKQEMQRLLEGGLIGRAMAASAAWHAMQAQAAAREQQEWRLLKGGGGLGGEASRESSTRGGSASGAGAAGSDAECSHELPQASSCPSQLLPTLAEEQEGDGEGEGQQQEGSGHQPSGSSAGLDAASSGGLGGPGTFDMASAEALVSAFADAEVRHYLQGSLASLAGPPRPTSHPGASVSSGAADGPAAGSGLPAAASSSCPPCLSTMATTGGDAAAATGYGHDSMLRAWMVTRAPPDLPVRGFQAPPSRAACRLVAAQEMRQYFQQQRQQQGAFFKHLRLVEAQAGGRGSDGAAMALQPADSPAAAPQRKTLKGAVRKSVLLKQMVGMGQQSKAAVWAKEHAQQVEAAAAEQLRQEREREQAAAAVAAAKEARAAVTAAPRQQAGAAAGSAFAAIVQQAAERQHEQQAGGAAQGNASPATASRRASKLPALHLQKLTDRWHRAATGSAAAAGEQTARERKAAAEAERLKGQWEAVRHRLPAARNAC